ncbi:hypothetical protein Glove_374g24 [Diversispora epigaea]|uniref:Uncharacterized protein n=1 Tax=Diversispora epigaea TaxID=1348612 RepID=A0A397H5D6_9GLOM|nr:hypothetical protein Glove_374g24 [Diversispora epigaea]
MSNFETLLENININNIHPPPEIDEVLNFFNSKRPMRDHNRCHAFMIFRYSVAKECKRIGESNAILIGRVTNRLWRASPIGVFLAGYKPSYNIFIFLIFNLNGMVLILGESICFGHGFEIIKNILNFVNDSYYRKKAHLHLYIQSRYS